MKKEQFPDTAKRNTLQPVEAQQAPAKPKLFFDISNFIGYVRMLDRYSGIQRVVAMVLIEMAQQVEPDRLYVSYISNLDGRHYAIRVDEIGVQNFLSPSDIRGVLYGHSLGWQNLTSPGSLVRQLHRGIVGLVQIRPLRRIPLVLGKKVAGFVFGAFAGLWRRLFSRAPNARTIRRPLRDVASRGDRLILLDSSWHAFYGDGFTRAHADGLVIHTMVHDLIPLVAAATTDGEMPKVFGNWIRTSRDYTSVYLANSEATRRDLEAYLQSHDVQKPVRVLPLAQTGLRLASDKPAAPHLPVRAAAGVDYAFALEVAGKSYHIRSLVNVPYVLCVGTIEARKNIWRLLIAWKSMIDLGKKDIPRLVLAGRKGWMAEQAFDLLAGTGNLYGYVSVIEGPSDEDLAFLYRNCLFTAMVSLYEGWGLPVGEALSYGKTAVVSHSTSLPEVGQDLVEYCDPLSIQSIANAVLKLVENPVHRHALEARIRQTRLRDWSDVARELLQIVDDPAMVAADGHTAGTGAARH